MKRAPRPNTPLKSAGIRTLWNGRWWRWHFRRGVSHLRWRDAKGNWRLLLKRMQAGQRSREVHRRRVEAANAPDPRDTPDVLKAAADARALVPGTRCVITGGMLQARGILETADRSHVWVVDVCECDMCDTGRFVCCVGHEGERRTFAKAALRPERLDRSRDEPPAWLSDIQRAGLHKGLASGFYRHGGR